MKLLVLGRGKTGRLVASRAAERGHAVAALGSGDNPDGRALTAEFVRQFDAVIDFTTPEAVAGNLERCLRAGARVVVGTTGWAHQLPGLTALAVAHSGSLLYGTNFSLGVQAYLRAARLLAAALPGASYQIAETHHLAKKDAPSGTALTLQSVLLEALPPGTAIPLASTREGDVAGRHVLEVRTASDSITLQHDALSRAGFAEGAVLAVEWLVAQPAAGVWAFADVAAQLAKGD